MHRNVVELSCSTYATSHLPIPHFFPHPSLIINQLRRRLEANADTEELQKHIKVLQVRVERERHRAGELETALKAARESAASKSSPPDSGKGHSTVNNKVRILFVLCRLLYLLLSPSVSFCLLLSPSASFCLIPICHALAALIGHSIPSCDCQCGNESSNWSTANLAKAFMKQCM